MTHRGRGIWPRVNMALVIDCRRTRGPGRVFCEGSLYGIDVIAPYHYHVSKPETPTLEQYTYAFPLK